MTMFIVEYSSVTNAFAFAGYTCTMAVDAINAADAAMACKVAHPLCQIVSVRKEKPYQATTSKADGAST